MANSSTTFLTFQTFTINSSTKKVLTRMKTSLLWVLAYRLNEPNVRQQVKIQLFPSFFQFERCVIAWIFSFVFGMLSVTRTNIIQFNRLESWIQVCYYCNKTVARRSIFEIHQCQRLKKNHLLPSSPVHYAVKKLFWVKCVSLIYDKPVLIFFV